MRKHIPIQFIMRINFDRFKVILSSISYSIVSFNQRTVERFSSLFLVFNSNFIFLSCLPVFQKLSRSRNHPLAPYFAFALSLSVSLSAEKSVEYLRATYQTIEIDISFSFFFISIGSLAVDRHKAAMIFCPSSPHTRALILNRFACAAIELRNKYFSIQCLIFSPALKIFQF